MWYGSRCGHHIMMIMIIWICWPCLSEGFHTEWLPFKFNPSKDSIQVFFSFTMDLISLVSKWLLECQKRWIQFTGYSCRECWHQSLQLSCELSNDRELFDTWLHIFFCEVIHFFLIWKSKIWWGNDEMRHRGGSTWRIIVWATDKSNELFGLSWDIASW